MAQLPRIVEIDRFLVRSDSGITYLMVEYQRYANAESIDGKQPEELEDSKVYITDKGIYANCIGQDTFKLLGRFEKDNVIVKRIK